MPPSSPGTLVVAATAATPGNACTASTTRLKNAARAWFSSNASPVTYTRIVSSRRVVEAKVCALQRQEAPDHQVGADEQSQAERDLSDRERSLGPLRRPPQRQPASALLEIFDDARPRGAQRRQQPDRESRQDGQQRP